MCYLLKLVFHPLVGGSTSRRLSGQVEPVEIVDTRSEPCFNRVWKHHTRIVYPDLKFRNANNAISILCRILAHTVLQHLFTVSNKGSKTCEKTLI